MITRWSAPASAVAIASLLAACVSQQDEQVLAACPPVQIAVPADRLGHNNENGELRFIAFIDELISSCRQDKGDIEVDIAFTMSTQRGPALDAELVPVSYFLATVDPNREIVDKQILYLELDLGEDKPVSALRETVTVRLPASTEATGANYNLYLGFQPDRQPSQRQAKARPPKTPSASTPKDGTPAAELTTADRSERSDETQSAATSPSLSQNSAVEPANDRAIEFTFDLNSSILPQGTDERLRALVNDLDKNKRYELSVLISLDGNARVLGASAEETKRYNAWLADRRFQRIESWFRENGNGLNLTLQPSRIENDSSRRVRIEANTLG